MSTFEEQKEVIRLAVLAAIRVHVPAYQTEWVQWADAPQYMQAGEGSIELAFASVVAESDREKSEPVGTDRVTTRSKVYRCALDISTELIGAAGMDLMGKIVDGFDRQSVIDALDPVKLLGKIRGVQFVKLRADNRVKPLWICEAKLRFDVSYPTAPEAQGTIGTVQAQVIFDHTEDFDPPNEIDTQIEVSKP